MVARVFVGARTGRVSLQEKSLNRTKLEVGGGDV